MSTWIILRVGLSMLGSYIFNVDNTKPFQRTNDSFNPLSDGELKMLNGCISKHFKRLFRHTGSFSKILVVT
jgi:hypothetical protein